MKSFNEIYEEIYKNNHEELEVLRKSKAKNTAIIIIITIVGMLLIIKNFGMFAMYFAWIFAVLMIIIVLVTNGNKKDFTIMFKQKVIEPFIKNVDENLNYYPKQGIMSALYRRGEFESYDLYSSEDLIEGVLDGKYPIKMAEVHTQDESRDSDGDRHTYTLFYGIFGNVECAKDVGTTIKIRSDKGVLGKLFTGKTKIEMDSSDFEKNFDVYAENKIIAMQILTSDIMTMMMEFKEQSKIRYEITINQKQLYIRFHTGEVFEPKIFTNSLDYEMLKRYYDIIEFIFNVSRKLNKVIETTEI